MKHGMEKWSFPTVCLSIDVCSDPTGEEWLLQRSTCNRIENGRFDLEVKILDQCGHLVAISKHICMVVPARGAQQENAVHGKSISSVL